MTSQQETYDYLQAVYASVMFKDVIPRLNTADINSRACRKIFGKRDRLTYFHQ